MSTRTSAEDDKSKAMSKEAQESETGEVSADSPAAGVQSYVDQIPNEGFKPDEQKSTKMKKHGDVPKSSSAAGFQSETDKEE